MNTNTTFAQRSWESMSTVWAGVGEKRKRGLRILPKEGGYFVHVTSRTVGQAFMFGDVEKRVFIQMMRKWAYFSGLSVITYCLMDNHFHMMLWVPEAVKLDHGGMLDRLERVWPEEKVVAWEKFYQQQKVETREEMERALCVRMSNLPEFMRVLKQSFTRWYNWKHERSGVLWDARYRSVVVEDSPLALMSVAAYIDLNPLRAAMVEDPMAYAWSGYGAAIGGELGARRGLESLVALARGHQPYAAIKAGSKKGGRKEQHQKQLDQKRSQSLSPPSWEDVQAAYRIWLVNKGASKAAIPQANPKMRKRKGFDPIQVIAEYEQQGYVPLVDTLQMRMNTFSRGVAIGSPGFLEKLMGQYRSCFGSHRKSASKKVKAVGALWESLREVD
ncbi:hypothetical protein P3T73_03830 [Kiritimatiellota bacterium B12222]|nr:hypothetical protein P3T73_03830 [Kiritimatiellota bacterium B12222]